MNGSSARWPVATILAGVAVLVLAGLAVRWPHGDGLRPAGIFLILDPEPGSRQRQVYPPLAAYCGEVLGRDLRVTVVMRTADFLALAPRATVMLCPDAVAMRISGANVLAVGRRRAPHNLRPTSVLVSRSGSGDGQRPWLRAPTRTVFGDSLSLVCLAPLCQESAGTFLPAGVSFGNDPYDHRPVLEALRLGVFDHAVVRQWAAEEFLAAEGDQAGGWQVVALSEPMPDVILLAGGELSGQQRLTLGEAAVTLGRRDDAASTEGLVAQAALAGLQLDGFSVLLDPDFEALRGRYRACWPSPGE